MKPRRPTPSFPVKTSSRHRFSRSRFSRRASLGFTFIELLLALVLGLAVVTLGIAVTVGFRNIFVQDTATLTADDSVTSALDSLGLDVWQIGQNLGSVRNFPALQVSNTGPSGSSIMVVRQNPLDSFRICEIPTAAASPVVVGIQLNPPVSIDSADADNNDLPDEAEDNPTIAAIIAAANIPGCLVTPSSDDLNNDGWPDRLAKWRDYRLNNNARGITTLGYAFDGANVGAFFNYNGEANTSTTTYTFTGRSPKAGTSVVVTRYTVSSQQAWNTLGFTLADMQRYFLYLSEERRYQLSGGNLTLAVNGSNNAVSVVSGLDTSSNGFGVQVTRDDNTQLVNYCALPAQTCAADQTWARIRSIRVTVSSNAANTNSGIRSAGRVSGDSQGGVGFDAGATTQRQLSKTFFPRAVMSF